MSVTPVVYIVPDVKKFVNPLLSDTWYVYPLMPAPLSLPVDRTRSIVFPVALFPVKYAPLNGIISVGLVGAVVSRYLYSL